MATSLFDDVPNDPNARTTPAIAGLLASMSTPPVQQTPSGGLFDGPATSAPAVLSSQMPRFAPPSTAQQPRLVDRLHTRLQGLLDSVRPSDPTGGYGGLLSPDEVQRAQPGRIESLIERVAGLGSDIFTKEAYRQNLERAAVMHGIAQQVAEQRRIYDSRRQMAEMFPAAPNETIGDKRARVANMYAWAVQHGDLDAAKTIGQVADTVFAPPTGSQLHEVPGVGLVDTSGPEPRVVMPSKMTPHIVQAQEGVFEQRGDGLYNVATGQKWTGGTVHPISMMPNFSFPVVTGENGQQIMARANTKTGEITPTDVQAKLGGAGGGSSVGSLAPFDDMVARYHEVAQHADALGRKEWKITAPMQQAEGAAYGITREAAHGDASLSKLATQGVLSAAGVTKTPDYQRYQQMMESNRALGDDIAKVFKGRQNEEAVLREVALAQLTPYDYGNPTVVAQKMQRLRNVIKLAGLTNRSQVEASQNDLSEFGLSRSGAMPAQSSTPSRAQQLWDAAVRKHGRAKVLAEYGPRPAQ